MNFKKSFGLVQIPLLIGLLLMAVAIPVATRLVQDNQANQGKAATADIPCKVCVGSLCKTVATNCMATMNECNTNANCVISCSTVCPAVCSTTYLGSYCGVDGCGKACYGTKPFPPTVVPTKIPTDCVIGQSECVSGRIRGCSANGTWTSWTNCGSGTCAASGVACSAGMSACSINGCPTKNMVIACTGTYQTGGIFTGTKICTEDYANNCTYWSSCSTSNLPTSAVCKTDEKQCTSGKIRGCSNGSWGPYTNCSSGKCDSNGIDCYVVPTATPTTACLSDGKPYINIVQCCSNPTHYEILGQSYCGSPPVCAGNGICRAANQECCTGTVPQNGSGCSTGTKCVTAPTPTATPTLPRLGGSCTTSGGWPGTCTYDADCDNAMAGIAWDGGACSRVGVGCCGVDPTKKCVNGETKCTDGVNYQCVCNGGICIWGFGGSACRNSPTPIARCTYNGSTLSVGTSACFRTSASNTGAGSDLVTCKADGSTSKVHFTGTGCVNLATCPGYCVQGGLCNQGDSVNYSYNCSNSLSLCCIPKPTAIPTIVSDTCCCPNNGDKCYVSSKCSTADWKYPLSYCGISPTQIPTKIPTPTTTAPCYVTTSPGVLNLTVVETKTLTAVVSSGLGTASITRINFGSYNSSIATVSPISDTTSPYMTGARGVSAGSAAVWATATLSDGRTCQSTASTDTNVNVGSVLTATPSVCANGACQGEGQLKCTSNNQYFCNGSCWDLVRSCGAAGCSGNVCATPPTPSVCANGACQGEGQLKCTSNNQYFCNGSCWDLVRSCGAAGCSGNVCATPPTPSVCANGACQGEGQLKCTSNNQYFCNGSCWDLVRSCGAAGCSGNVCATPPTPSVCANGACQGEGQLKCTSNNQYFCNGSCWDLVRSCGAAGCSGNVCATPPTPSVCANGACQGEGQLKCTSNNQYFCNGSCWDLVKSCGVDGCSGNVCKQPSTPTPTKVSTLTPTKVPTLIPTEVPTATPTPSACTQCPSDFQCYTNGDEYRWFVSGYVMEDFNMAVSGPSCGNVPKPSYYGKTKGDANCDGKIDIADYSLWHTEFYAGDAGAVTNKNWNADFTGTNGVCDGKVDILDYSLWHKYFFELGIK